MLGSPVFLCFQVISLAVQCFSGDRQHHLGLRRQRRPPRRLLRQRGARRAAPRTHAAADHEHLVGRRVFGALGAFGRE